jgi:hypothetical protein
MFLNEVIVVPPYVPHILSFFGMPVAYQVCSVDKFNTITPDECNVLVFYSHREMFI